ncbi:piggybac transposase uribo2 [Vairimorpha apis BRL 01]|uniref:Piggybac transposase uribo2 n=1 Tax=Vairimorpha apis BRL 01 TaxID=1037528 RepID=T0MGZ1_9MICR|nr:piggybac transposase uribo2 [Vairimorpha apis BRL 01]
MSEYENNLDENDCSSSCEESDSGSDIVVRSHRVMQILRDSDDDDDNNYFSDTEDVPDCENIDVNLTQFTCLPPDTQYNKQTPHVFSELPGPKHTPPGDAKPIDFFNLFFTYTLIKKWLLKQTVTPHSFCKIVEACHHPRNERIYRRYTGNGHHKKANYFSYWMKGSRCIPWFAKMFARNRFQLLLKFFHLVDNKTLAPPGHPEYDPCARFQVLVNHANLVFRQHYIPNQQLSIDESLVGTNAHTVIKQYIPQQEASSVGRKILDAL